MPPNLNYILEQVSPLPTYIISEKDGKIYMTTKKFTGKLFYMVQNKIDRFSIAISSKFDNTDICFYFVNDLYF